MLAETETVFNSHFHNISWKPFSITPHFTPESFIAEKSKRLLLAGPPCYGNTQSNMYIYYDTKRVQSGIELISESWQNKSTPRLEGPHCPLARQRLTKKDIRDDPEENEAERNETCSPCNPFPSA